MAISIEALAPPPKDNAVPAPLRPRRFCHRSHSGDRIRQGGAWLGALAFAIAGVASPAGAQSSPPKEKAAPKPASSTATTPEGGASPAAPDAAPAKASASYPYEELSAAEASAVLHAIEGRLSVGETVDAEDRKAISTLLVRHPSPRVRAQATSVLPWLGPDVVGKALLRAMVDKDPTVRLQALLGMNVISRRFLDRHAPIRKAAVSAATELLDDESDDVACAATTLLQSLAPAKALEETRKREKDVSDVRHGCFRVVAQVPPRAIRVPSPTPPLAPNVAGTGEDQPESGLDSGSDETENDDGIIRGDGLFIASWAGAGLLMGAIVPTAISPPRDVLTYSRNRTSHAREEPSLISAAFAGAIGAGAFGAGAWALGEFVGPLDFAAASSVTLAATATGMTTLGATFAFGLDETGLGITLVSSGVLLMGSATALAYLIPPSAEDIAFATASTGLVAIAGSLTAFTLVPVGSERLFEDVDGMNPVARTDFGMGVGLMAGAAGTVLGLAASPLLDVAPMRSAVTAGGGVAGASFGLLGAYLLTPAGVDIRPRLAAGAGLVGEIAGATLAFFLVPDSWLGIVDVEVGEPGASGAVVLKDGALRLGVPQVVGIAPAGAGTAPAMGASLFGGRF